MGKAKYGMKNKIKLDILSYNIGLIGESGIGKTTTMKEVCEILAGEDGYLIANVGREDGVDAISGAMYVDIPDMFTFDDFVEDIIENKKEDYPKLKVIVWDTLDQLISIVEPGVVATWNELQQDKKKPKYADSINSAYGGWGKGEAQVIEEIMARMWELKKVGVRFIIVGHTKQRTMTDTTSGSEYAMLTTNIQQNYFNAFKTKLHFLGVASIDRKINEVATGKKDVITQKDITKGVVQKAKRICTFRDDNFAIDSKSRFADIIPEIEFTTANFIDALENAIKAEALKDGSKKSFEETAKIQAKEDTKKCNKVLKEKSEERKNRDAGAEQAELDSLINEIAQFVINNKATPVKLKPLLLKQKEFGVTNYKKIKDLDNTISEKIEMMKALIEIIK